MASCAAYLRTPAHWEPSLLLGTGACAAPRFHTTLDPALVISLLVAIADAAAEVGIRPCNCEYSMCSNQNWACLIVVNS